MHPNSVPTRATTRARLQSSRMLSDSEILRKIERAPRQSAGYKQLVRELRIKGDGRRELKERLADLVKRGKLIADAERFSIPISRPSKNQIFGRLSMHRDGYGFVIPESDEVRARISGDIYISPNAVDNAMH